MFSGHLVSLSQVSDLLSIHFTVEKGCSFTIFGKLDNFREKEIKYTPYETGGTEDKKQLTGLASCDINRENQPPIFRCTQKTSQARTLNTELLRTKEG